MHTIKDLINQLKKISLERYEIDRGVMCECFADGDYEKLLFEHGLDVEKAWAFHLRCVQATMESQCAGPGWEEEY